MRSVLAVLLILAVGPAAAAAPMAAKQYATAIQDEVDYQNYSCSEIDWIDHFLTELHDCGPPEPKLPPGSAAVHMGDLQSAQEDQTNKRICLSGCGQGTRAVAERAAWHGEPHDEFGVIVEDYCRSVSPPTYPISPQQYDALGPSLKATLKEIGVGRLMDVPHGIDPTAGAPMPSFAVSPLITYLQGPLEVAKRLKNCAD